MANAPCARLTKPISPMGTERPTDTMNSTMPAAMPPSSKLETSMPNITCRTRRQVVEHNGVTNLAGSLPLKGQAIAYGEETSPRPHPEEHTCKSFDLHV